MTLTGKRIGVFRAEAELQKTAELVVARGAEPVLVPLLSFAPPSDPRPFEAALSALGTYDWILFTSRQGVRATMEALGIHEGAPPSRTLGGARVGVIGPKTAAALRAWGMHADLVAENSDGEGFSEMLLSKLHRGARVLLLRAEVGRDVLPNALVENGIAVDVCAAYATRPTDSETLGPALRTMDAALLTSSSTVLHLVSALGDRETAQHALSRVVLASIGKVTTQTAEAHGLCVAVTALRPGMEELLGALEGYYAKVAAGGQTT